jgi:Raf kinase inhibitor-like YbhB/YbcL family protein
MSVSRERLLWLAAAALLMLAACGPKSPAGDAKPGPGGLTITSTAFAGGEPIPAKYTGDGDDVSPTIEWKGVPAAAKGLALICDDPDAPGGTFVHWLVYGIPAKVTGLPEGVPRDETLKSGAAQGTNDFGRLGYIGPSPPSGPVHHYHFRLYALDAPIGLKPGATRGDLDAAMKGHIIATGELVGTYRR